MILIVASFDEGFQKWQFIYCITSILRSCGVQWIINSGSREKTGHIVVNVGLVVSLIVVMLSSGVMTIFMAKLVTFMFVRLNGWESRVLNYNKEAENLNN